MGRGGGGGGFLGGGRCMVVLGRKSVGRAVFPGCIFVQKEPKHRLRGEDE